MDIENNYKNVQNVFNQPGQKETQFATIGLSVKGEYHAAKR